MARPLATLVTMIALVLLAVTTIVVFAIAAGVIGREAHRLDSLAPRSIYDVDEAVVYVADRLPADAQARVTYDELRQLLTIHMGRIHQLGLQPADVTDRPQDIAVPTFLEEIDETAYVIGRAEAEGLDVTDDDVAAAIEGHLAYLDLIGAVGPPADPAG